MKKKRVIFSASLHNPESYVVLGRNIQLIESCGLIKSGHRRTPLSLSQSRLWKGEWTSVEIAEIKQSTKSVISVKIFLHECCREE